MFPRDDAFGDGSSARWKQWLLPRLTNPSSASWLRRYEPEIALCRWNESEARRLFLAHVVYGVPEEWLDDVVRVRLSELKVTE